MSAQARPISPTRFASALQGLALPNLYGKVSELRNQLAHLDYSNQEMQAFAAGTAPGLTEPDKECAAAIEENEVVIRRILERLALLRSEIEERGSSWLEGQADEEVRLANGHASGEGDDVGEDGAEEEGIVVNPAAPERRSGPWTDGTFTTGRFVNGEVVMDGAEETADEARRVLGNSIFRVDERGANGTAPGIGLASRPRANGSGTDEATDEHGQPGRRTGEEDEEDGGIHL
jgi:hypothetical protein